MPALETASLSHPLQSPLSHADKAVCPSVPALLAGNPALPFRQPALCSGTEHMLGSLTLSLLTHLSVSVLQIPRDERGSYGPVSRKMVDLGAYLPH